MHMITKITNLDGNVVGVTLPGKDKDDLNQFRDTQHLSEAGMVIGHVETETMGAIPMPITPMGFYNEQQREDATQRRVREMEE